MPIKTSQPFHDPLARMRPEVNRYMSLLREGAASGELDALYGPALERWPGRWREYFTERMPRAPQQLVLEIGSHFGEVILKMAAEHPATALIGMDITFKRVVKLAEKSRQAGLRNLTSVLCNAQSLDELFVDGELDGIFIFFPDPWAQKKRQMKNRLVKTEFVKVLQRKLRPGGFFWFKTDCQPYFEDVRACFDGKLWSEPSLKEGLPAETYTSRFERLFREQGLPCYEFSWQNRTSKLTDG